MVDTEPITSVALPGRPKRSNWVNQIGTHVDYITNMYKITYTGFKTIFNYNVAISPEVPDDARKLKDSLIGGVREGLEQRFKKDYYKSGNNLFAFVEIKEPFVLNVKRNDIDYSIVFRLVSSSSLQDITPLNGKNSNITTHILNVMIKKGQELLGMRELGRNSKYYDGKQMFDQKVDFDTKHAFYVWKGFKTSVNLCSEGQYLQVDFSSKVIQDMTVYELIQSYNSDDEAARAIEGRSIVGDYGNNRLYRIDQLVLNMTPKSTFDRKDGSKMTYLDYYEKSYGKKIKNPNQPLIRYFDKKTNQDIFLIPELMLLTGLTDADKANFRLMQAVANFTKLNPSQRTAQIQGFAEKLSGKSKEMNVNININVPKTNGFLLKGPEIQMGSSTLTPQSGNFMIRNVIEAPCKLQNWVFIYQSRGKQDDADADKMVDDFIKIGQGFGINVQDPGFITVSSNKPEDWIKELENDIRKNGNPSFVVSYYRGQGPLYSKLKDFLYHGYGIPSQHINPGKGLEKNRMSVVSKILLQINAKLGRPLWIVPRPKEIPSTTMIIGIDFCHFNKRQHKASIGIVASLDAQFSDYWSKVIITEQNTNVVSSLTAVITEAILTWFKENKNTFPTNIIIYRDGVGEGQLQQVVDTEINQILASFSSIDKNFKPSLAYILINKQINLRYFTEAAGGYQTNSRGGKGAQGSISNPLSGSILSEKITSQHFEFYLAAQNVTQGTCTPTKYTVGYNSTNFSEDTFWQLTYFQCFNYFNWSGAVRVPAAVQYAHKLAYLIGDTFQKEVNKNLRYGLYYL